MPSSAVQENSNVYNNDTKKYTKRPEIPDEEKYRASLEEVKNKIDKLHEELNAINAKIDDASDNSNVGNVGGRREELKDKLDKLRGKQAEIKKNRLSTMDQIKSLSDSVQRKKRDLKQSKDKYQYRTVKDIDIAISKKEKLIESGTLKIIDEKKTITEISNLERSKKSVKLFEIQQNAIDEEQRKIDELRKTLDDSESKKTNEEYDNIKAELDVINKDYVSDREKRNELIEERSKIRDRINEEYSNKRAIQDQHNKARAEFRKYQEDEQKRRHEYKRKLYEERENQHQQELAARKREEAAIPAFQSDIITCENLINYFQSLNGGTVKSPQQQQSSATTPDNNIRQPDATSNVPKGAVLMKKSDRDDDYFVGGGKKHRKPQKEKKSGKSNAFQLPLSVMEELISLNIATPHNFSEIEQTIKGLTQKKEYFIENQERVTKENIEKAEAEIAAMKTKGHKDKDNNNNNNNSNNNNDTNDNNNNNNNNNSNNNNNINININKDNEEEDKSNDKNKNEVTTAVTTKEGNEIITAVENSKEKIENA